MEIKRQSPATLAAAIDSVLALIDDPARWPETNKAKRGAFTNPGNRPLVRTCQLGSACGAGSLKNGDRRFALHYSAPRSNRDRPRRCASRAGCVVLFGWRLK